MSAELRAQIRSGITGLGLAGSRPATAVPVLGDETRRILGVKEDEDEDSAIEDPNTESLKRPVSVQQPGVFSVTIPPVQLSPPTKMRTEKSQAGSEAGLRNVVSRKSPGESQIRK